ncbi:RES family NAD+ phosphorylase [Duganella sp. BJB476]|uniref:RES family NAD+ phosphorylase n=1 Tax=Duganella sp. BJB476 TaxID=1871176 RepID=UPI001314F410|nr:RES family NAD+ phosphorylase [Duganella sp. BJB476]
MAASSLGPPPAVLSSEPFRATLVAPETLFRISSYTTGEPFFGRSGGNRFDAPGWVAGASQFGACYLGATLEVALAESVLHDRLAVAGKFMVANTVLAGSYVHRFDGEKLRLLNLTGAILKRLNGHAELTGTGDYHLPQQWSLAVFNNPAMYDGFIYASRHATLSKAVVLFDRAQSKLHSASHSVLIRTPGYVTVARKFGIVGI